MNEIAFQIIDASEKVMNMERETIEVPLKVEFSFLKKGNEFLLIVENGKNKTTIHQQIIKVKNGKLF
jgi:hypothetical protein